MISDAKKNPGKLKYASTGVGSGSHLITEILKLEAGIDIQYVPFKGGGPKTAALLGGHVDLMFVALSPEVPFIKSGETRVLVCAEKMKEFPEVPTLAEKGYPRTVFGSWVGFLEPKGIEKSVIDKISSAIEKTLKVPKVVKGIEDSGSQVDFAAKEEFGREIEKESQKMVDVVKKAKLIVK